jgi:amidohydrolase
VLTNSDIAELTDWRRLLHRNPELSRQERATAARVAEGLRALGADRVVTGLGGHGVAGIFEGHGAGPSVLFRAELDALPIAEQSDAAHRSSVPGTAHLCGHEGHMTFLMGLARLLSRQRPARGRAVLMFQPAEEDGSGAAAVTADPAYAGIRPDWAFSIHNMPGLPLGRAALKAGTVNCASVGLLIRLSGKTAHASQPEAGLSPAPAVARLIPALTALGPGGAPDAGYRLATVTHVRVGEPAFGVAPGEAEIRVTLRTTADATMDALRAGSRALAAAEAQAAGLTVAFSEHDDFAASVNDPQATAHLAAALETLGIAHDEGGLPMRASEDFGRFGRAPTRSAMLFLGAGERHPALHNPDYDFPDALIPLGVSIFHRTLRDLLG